MSTVATNLTKPAVVYPESDGLPLSDNTKQFRWIMTIEGGCRSFFDELPYELSASGNELCRLVASVPVRLLRGVQKAKRLLTSR